MRFVKTVSAGLLLIALLTSFLPAQPPPAPVINPAVARADGVVGDLEGPGTSLAYLEDSRLLIVASEGGLAYLVDDAMQGVRSGDGPQPLVSDTHGPILAVTPAAGGFAAAGIDGKVRFWTGVSRIARTVDAGGPIRALAAAPGGQTLAIAGDDGLVSLLVADKPPTKLEGAVDWQMAVAFSPDGKLLAAGGYDGKWRLWDLTTSKKTLDIEALPPLPAAPPPGTPPRATNVISALAFSPDGKTLALGGSDGLVHLFQSNDGKFIRSLTGHTSAITSLAFHPGGALLVSASKDRTLRLWNPTNPQPLKVLEGHTAWVQGVTFLAQGTRLASVGADSTVRMWDLTEPKK